MGHFPRNLSDSIIIFFIHLLVNLLIGLVLQIPKFISIIIIEYFEFDHLPTISEQLIIPPLTLAPYPMQKWPIKILHKFKNIGSLSEDIIRVYFSFFHFLIVHDEVHVALSHIFIYRTYHLCIFQIVCNGRSCLICYQGFFYHFCKCSVSYLLFLEITYCL